MTENERQEILNDIKDGYIDAWDNLTIDELFKQIEKEHEEIQQYRAIGTVEHIKLTFELCKGLDAMAKMYEAIGTIEEFKSLKECFGHTVPKSRGKAIYDKAIDEFAEKIKEVYPFTLLELEQLDEIVKILKKEK